MGERIAVLLRSARVAAGLSQEELAQRCGLSPRTISQLERGRVDRPRLATIRLLADALDLDEHARRRFTTTGFEAHVVAPAETGAQMRPVADVPAQLPLGVTAFTGRTVELAELDGVFGSGGALPHGAWPDRPGIALIVGTGGVGKTALAVRWAHRVRDRFPDGQLIVDLCGFDSRRPVDPGAALATMLRALGVDGRQVPDDVEARAALFRTRADRRRMLLVLDNAATVDQVRPLLPGIPSCIVIVTSRDDLAGLVALHGAHRIVLPRLPPKDSATLLRRLVGPRAEVDAESTRTLAEQCAHLPLALRVAAEVVASRPGVRLAQFTSELAGLRGRLDVLDTTDAPHGNVRLVLSWSCAGLAEPAATAFRMLGLHGGASFDAEAVAALAGVDTDEGRRITARLARAHLIEPVGSDRWALHDLLRAYAVDAAAAADPTDSSLAALTRLLDHLLASALAATNLMDPAAAPRRPTPPLSATAVSPATPAAALAWLNTERHNLVAACMHAEEHGMARHAIHLAQTLHRYLTGCSLTDAMTVMESSYRAARRLADDNELAKAYTGMGNIDWEAGRYERAADRFRQALDRQRPAGDRTGMARTTGNLGLVYWRLGNYHAAVDCHIDALCAFVDAGLQVEQAVTMNNLGLALDRLDRDAEAVACYRRALHIHRRTGNTDSAARAMTNLGKLRGRTGRLHLANLLHRRALTLFTTVGSLDGVARTLTNLGDTEAAGHRFTSALRYQRQALEAFTNAGIRSGQTSALNGLGEASLGSGSAAAAVHHHTDALTLADELSERHEQVRAHTGLARALQAVGDVCRADAHWAQATVRAK